MELRGGRREPRALRDREARGDVLDGRRGGVVHAERQAALPGLVVRQGHARGQRRRRREADARRLGVGPVAADDREMVRVLDLEAVAVDRGVARPLAAREVRGVLRVAVLDHEEHDVLSPRARRRARLWRRCARSWRCCGRRRRRCGRRRRRDILELALFNRRLDRLGLVARALVRLKFARRSADVLKLARRSADVAAQEGIDVHDHGAYFARPGHGGHDHGAHFARPGQADYEPARPILLEILHQQSMVHEKAPPVQAAR